MTFHHWRKKKPGKCGQRGDVEVNLPKSIFQGHTCKFTETAIASIVHQDVNRDTLALQLIEQKLRRRRRYKIEGDGLDHNAELPLQIIGELNQIVSATRYQHQVVMIAGEEFGQFVSDAARSSGNECCLLVAHITCLYQTKEKRANLARLFRSAIKNLCAD